MLAIFVLNQEQLGRSISKWLAILSIGIIGLSLIELILFFRHFF